MAEFSLHLNDDQLQIQEWVHTFAKDVIRPAAREWDDREEFPWPVVQEAAKIGLYGWEFLMNAMSDPTGLRMPVAIVAVVVAPSRAASGVNRSPPTSGIHSAE